MNHKLKTKDLVTVGIFTLIYFVVMFAVGMMGIVPLLFLVYPSVLAIVAGVVVMLFMAKVPKNWALFIMAMIPPLVMFAMGHTYVMPLISIPFALAAEFLFRKKEFKSFKYNSLAYAVLSCIPVNTMMQIFLAHDKYIEMSSKMMPEEYIIEMEKMITIPHVSLSYVGAFLCAFIGAYIGKAMLKKHFKKAGIV